MKRYAVTFVILAFAALIIGCTQPFNGSDTHDAVTTGLGPAVPADEVSDTLRPRSATFTYETIYPVELRLDVNLFETDETGQVLGDELAPGSATIFVALTDAEGNGIYAGKLAEDGTISATVVLPAAAQDVTMTLSAEGFEPRTVTIRDMVTRSVVNRVMSMKRVVSTGGTYLSRALSGLEDTDGDGVPDVYDAFPTDPDSAFEVNIPAEGKMTVAFEDLFGRANAGDADYNDLVAAYAITEVMNDAGLVTRLTVDADVVTKLAGYNHRFGIRIDSFEGAAELSGEYIDEGGAVQPLTGSVSAPAEIILFENSRYAVGTSASFTLDFAIPQQHQAADPGGLASQIPLPNAPYNPFAIVKNTGHDIHLIGRQPLTQVIDSINPGDTFLDQDGFPWALLVPDSWINPEETQRIEIPYPRFTLWRESGGEEHADWYLHYYDPYVPPVVQRDVYVAGFYNDGTNDTAAYWQDGAAGLSRHDLPAAGASEATDLFVDTSKVVYATGYYENGGVDTVAYWADGALKDLETGGRATGIYVADSGVVYVSGYYNDGTRNVAAYWKDDASSVSRQVVHGSSVSRATDLWVDPSGVVYVAGYYSDGSHDVAAYWMDSAGVVTRVDLYTAGLSQANALTIDGTDVYVAGRYLDGSVLAAYWVNDGTGLNPLAGNAANASDIVRTGAATYVAGDYLRADFVRQATIWDGTGQTDLASADAATPTFAYGMTASQGDIYVAGVHIPSVQEAVYWIAGTLVPLSPGVRSKANAIFVRE